MMFEQSLEARNEQLQKAIEAAGGYVPRDPNVLQLLRDAVQRPLPPAASHAELAYAEGQRALVAMICRQYQLAMTGILDTPWQTIQAPLPKKRPRRQPPRSK